MSFGDVDHLNVRALESYDRLAEAGPNAGPPGCIVLGCENDAAGDDGEMCTFHIELLDESPFT